MRPAIDQLPRASVAADLGQRVVRLIGVALQKPPPIPGQEVQRMRLAPPGGVMEQNDGWAGTAMAVIISNHLSAKYSQPLSALSSSYACNFVLVICWILPDRSFLKKPYRRPRTDLPLAASPLLATCRRARSVLRINGRFT